MTSSITKTSQLPDQKAASNDGDVSTNIAPAPVTDAEDALVEIIIRPTSGWRLVNLAEFWQYRALLYFLTWRDVKVRYKQTLLGAAWAVIVPITVALLVVGSLYFHRTERPECQWFHRNDAPDPRYSLSTSPRLSSKRCRSALST